MDTGGTVHLQMLLLVSLVLCAVFSGGFAALPEKGTPVFAVFSNGPRPKNDTRFPSLEPRIVGGETMKAPIKYQVSLRAQVDPNSTGPSSLVHYCGAALISETHVLTAAHCFDGDLLKYLEKGAIYAVMGTIYNNFDPSKTFVSMVQAAIIHPRYNRQDPNAHHDDIAVLKLRNRAPVNSNGPVSTVQLNPNLPRAGERCTISGWGVEQYTASPSSAVAILKAATVPIVAKPVCIQRYSVYNYANKLNDGMLCAGEDLGGTDSCQGDSGGPLVCGGKVTGLVSWGINCGQPRIPGVYASVPFYLQWVFESMGRLDAGVPSAPETPTTPPPLPLSATRSTTNVFTIIFVCVIFTKASTWFY